VKEAGGPEQSAKTVKFPDKGEDSTEIRISGTAPVVSKVVAAIEGFVAEKESQIVDSIDVPPEKHRKIIGRGGDIRRNLEQEFKVAIEIPRNGSGKTAVKISGTAPAVAAAKERIADMVKESGGETVRVPNSVHHAVAQGGRLFLNLKRDYDVTVDHGGQKPPRRPQNDAPRARTNGAAPLITDEPGADARSWFLEEAIVENGDAGTIPWILIGKTPEQVSGAKAEVERALESALNAATGYLVLTDPSLHRLVIGPGGRNVNDIRRKTGCQVQVPRAGSGESSEAIVITGGKTAVEEAKRLILESVRNGSQRS